MIWSLVKKLQGKFVINGHKCEHAYAFTILHVFSLLSRTSQKPPPLQCGMLYLARVSYYYLSKQAQPGLCPVRGEHLDKKFKEFTKESCILFNRGHQGTISEWHQGELSTLSVCTSSNSLLSPAAHYYILMYRLWIIIDRTKIVTLVPQGLLGPLWRARGPTGLYWEEEGGFGRIFLWRCLTLLTWGALWDPEDFP